MKRVLLALAIFSAATFTTFAATPEEVKRDTPQYDNVEDLVETIVAQHPGKVVFVDFWATWCGPCVAAMETMKPIKPWMEENGIVKVYLSAPTSKPEKWEEMIGDIGGDHYWINQDEWKAICNKFGIKGIPTYQIYGKDGKLSFQQSGYPGNDTMKEEFEKVI